MLFATNNGFGQTGSPEFKDTSQTITKEELFQERAENKVRTNKEKDAKRQTRAYAILRKKNQNVVDTSKKTQKTNKEAKHVKNARTNAATKQQKDFDAHDKADK
jgi:hypothetical protein